MSQVTDEDVAQALVSVIGESCWIGVALAHGYLALRRGEDEETIARAIHGRARGETLRRCREAVQRLQTQGFLPLLQVREKKGSAENPITKLFPAAITEQRFIEMVDRLRNTRRTLDCADDRESGHSFVDFTLREGDVVVPLNIKNAGTRFERAQALVGLDPEDCIPIPAYKAHGALEDAPNLLYAVCVDYALVDHLNSTLPTLLTPSERIVWRLLNEYAGSRIRDAEDAFIFGVVRRDWERLKAAAADNPFHVISARKAVRILNTRPKRTPGIGMRAWGTGASAEVNVHVSIKFDTTPWCDVHDRICQRGLQDIAAAVNRRKLEMVYDPEI